MTDFQGSDILKSLHITDSRAKQGNRVRGRLDQFSGEGSTSGRGRVRHCQFLRLSTFADSSLTQ